MSSNIQSVPGVNFLAVLTLFNTANMPPKEMFIVVIWSDETVTMVPEAKLNAPEGMIVGRVVRKQHQKDLWEGKIESCWGMYSFFVLCICLSNTEFLCCTILVYLFYFTGGVPCCQVYCCLYVKKGIFPPGTTWPDFFIHTWEGTERFSAASNATTYNVPVVYVSFQV